MQLVATVLFAIFAVALGSPFPTETTPLPTELLTPDGRLPDQTFQPRTVTSQLQTNAQRLSRRLPPLAPKRRFASSGHPVWIKMPRHCLLTLPLRCSRQGTASSCILGTVSLFEWSSSSHNEELTVLGPFQDDGPHPGSECRHRRRRRLRIPTR